MIFTLIHLRTVTSALRRRSVFLVLGCLSFVWWSPVAHSMNWAAVWKNIREIKSPADCAATLQSVLIERRVSRFFSSGLSISNRLLIFEELGESEQFVITTYLAQAAHLVSKNHYLKGLPVLRPQVPKKPRISNFGGEVQTIGEFRALIFELLAAIATSTATTDRQRIETVEFLLVLLGTPGLVDRSDASPEDADWQSAPPEARVETIKAITLILFQISAMPSSHNSEFSVTGAAVNLFSDLLNGERGGNMSDPDAIAGPVYDFPVVQEQAVQALTKISVDPRFKDTDRYEALFALHTFDRLPSANSRLKVSVHHLLLRPEFSTKRLAELRITYEQEQLRYEKEHPRLVESDDDFVKRMMGKVREKLRQKDSDSNLPANGSGGALGG